MRWGPVSILLSVLLLLTSATAPTSGAHPGIHEQLDAAETAIEQNPDDPNSHLALGRVLAEKGEFDVAVAAYEKARRLGAEAEKASFFEAAAYQEAGWPSMAKEKCNNILALSPGNPDALLGRARAWKALDHPDQAAKDYATAIETIDPLRPGYVLEYADALVAADRANEALPALDLGLGKLGMVPSLQLAAIDLNLKAEEYDAALERLDRLLAASPQHVLWLAQRAEILERAGRPAEARLAYTNALDHLRSRNAGGRARRLTELESRVRAALARPNPTQETIP